MEHDSRSEILSRRTDVEAQIEKVLTSRQFITKRRQSALLRHIVATYLRTDYQEGALTAKVLYNEVFLPDRQGNYSPDPEGIVRTTMSNLRITLTAYYQHDGASDPVIIDFPDEGYVPKITLRPPSFVITPRSPDADDVLKSRGEEYAASVTEIVSQFLKTLENTSTSLAWPTSAIERKRRGFPHGETKITVGASVTLDQLRKDIADAANTNGVAVPTEDQWLSIAEFFDPPGHPIIIKDKPSRLGRNGEWERGIPLAAAMVGLALGPVGVWIGGLTGVAATEWRERSYKRYISERDHHVRLGYEQALKQIRAKRKQIVSAIISLSQ